MAVPVSLVAFCVLSWCAFGSPEAPAIRLAAAQDAYAKNEDTDRLALASLGQVFSGVVSNRSHLAATVGVLPLRIGRGRVQVHGGVSYASHPVPVRGTRANWVAHARVGITERIAVEWWHLSNARTDGRNPALDALAVSWRVK